MLLDNGVAYIYRPDRPRGIQTPVDGLIVIYRDWFGELHHESGKGAEAGDMTRRIRIHDTDIRDYDIVRIDGLYWLVIRVYHGTDDDTGRPIADLTLSTGARYFVRLSLIPRKVELDELGTMTSTPDYENQVGIWANIGSVNADEYYTAEAAGHSLDMRVEVHAADYHGEPYVRYNDTTYEVRRTEQRGPVVFLTCEAMTAWRE